MKKGTILAQVEAIIASPQNYWRRLTALKALGPLTKRPHVEAARDRVAAFASLSVCPPRVRPAEWAYVKITLIHPLFGDFRHERSDIYGERHGWRPRGMRIPPTKTPFERRMAYVRRTYPDLYDATVDRLDSGYFHRRFGRRIDALDFRYDSRKRGMLWREPPHVKQQWQILRSELTAQYHAYQTFKAASGLSPAYFEQAMSLAEFQADAP